MIEGYCINLPSENPRNDPHECKTSNGIVLKAFLNR